MCATRLISSNPLRAFSSVIHSSSLTYLKHTRVTPKSCPTLSSHHIPLRCFATNMASKQEWLVVIPDFEGAIDKRVAIREKHLENVKPAVRSGKVLCGGATLAAPIKAGERPQMTGSVLIAQADTEEEVKEFLQKDVYVESGVWNWDAVKITPIKIAVRKGQDDLNC